MYYSLVVPCYNDRDALERLLKSYDPPDDDFEMIIVDDDSTDGTAEMIAEMAMACPVRYFRMGKNAGPAAARNRGVKEARGQVIVFCDSDITLGKDALPAIKRYFEEENAKSLLACGLIPPSNQGFFPLFKHYLELSWLKNNPVEHTEHFSARLGAVTRDLFLQAGGFDETICSASVEDFEFGHRLAKLTKTRICHDIMYAHCHPTFLRQALLFFNRASLYIPIMMTKGGPDNIGASSKEAGIALSGFLSQMLLILGIFWPKTAILGLFFFAVHVFFSRRLFTITLSKRGIGFTMYTIIVNYILSFFIVFGALWGMVRWLFKRGSDRGEV